MYLATEHPAYDPVMEFVCLLPMEGDEADMRDIAQDLRLSLKSTTALATNARDRGYGIRVENREKCRAAFVRIEDWNRIQREAGAYFDAVYGELN